MHPHTNTHTQKYAHMGVCIYEHLHTHTLIKKSLSKLDLTGYKQKLTYSVSFISFQVSVVVQTLHKILGKS